MRSKGLAPGASETLTFYTGSYCGGDYRAHVDSRNEVDEVNEQNNTKGLLGVIC